VTSRLSAKKVFAVLAAPCVELAHFSLRAAIFLSLAATPSQKTHSVAFFITCNQPILTPVATNLPSSSLPSPPLLQTLIYADRVNYHKKLTLVSQFTTVRMHAAHFL
jgi:hypothetical protein